MASLAEIIEEGERLEDAAEHTPAGWDETAWFMLRDFYSEHGPRLLAVCGAALRVQSDLDDCSTAPRTIEAVEALRAAVRGEEEKKG